MAEPACNQNFEWPRLPTQDDLPYSDGEPMDSPRHRLQMELLIRSLHDWEATHPNSFVGGDMFLYFNVEHLKQFRGPDFFVVLDVPPLERKSWIVWQEGKGPDVIIELLSESTAKVDKEEKKRIYQDQLRVSEYFWYDPFNGENFAGFRLVDGEYQPIPLDTHRRLHSQRMGFLLTRWDGVYGLMKTRAT